MVATVGGNAPALMPQGQFLNGPREGEWYAYPALSFMYAYEPPELRRERVTRPTGPTTPLELPQSRYEWRTIALGLGHRVDDDGRARAVLITREGWICR